MEEIQKQTETELDLACPNCDGNLILYDHDTDPFYYCEHNLSNRKEHCDFQIKASFIH